jgi:hypothetical protein
MISAGAGACRPCEGTTMTLSDRASLRSVYLYLICLVTLIMTIFAAVSVVRNVVELAYPDPGYYGFEPAYAPGGEPQQVDAQERERREQAAEDSQQRAAVISLVGSGTMLLIAVPVYLYHWRRVQEELSGGRRSAATTDQPLS